MVAVSFNAPVEVNAANKAFSTDTLKDLVSLLIQYFLMLYCRIRVHGK